MKTFSAQRMFNAICLDAPKKPKLGVGNGMTIAANPFPGKKYPTRLVYLIDVKGKDGHPITYTGKPSVEQVKRFQRLTEEYRSNRYFICEFDKKAVLWVMAQHGGLAAKKAFNPSLMRFYHPWNISGDYLASFRQKFWTKGIKAGVSQVLRVYSPVEKLNAKEQLTPHKKWLMDMGLMVNESDKLKPVFKPFNATCPCGFTNAGGSQDISKSVVCRSCRTIKFGWDVYGRIWTQII